VNVPIEVATNENCSAVTFRLPGGPFYLDAASARFFAAAIVRAAERVEARPQPHCPRPATAPSPKAR
jgi:hypothetical protein